MTHAVRWSLVFLLVSASATEAAAQTTLNLSRDLKPLGVAASNMMPGQPSLDAGPLFVQGVAYAQAHGIATVIADPGAYYFLTEQQPFNSVVLNQVANLTIDFQGSDLYFATVNAGLQFVSCSNLTVENFTVDRLQPGYTQLQVTAVDPTLRQIKFTVQPGWQAPSALNPLLNNPSIVFASPAQTDVFIFRDGGLWANYAPMPVQQPFNDDHLVIGPNGFVTSAILSSIRPGDIAVLRVRVGLAAIIADCSSCTFRNIRVYSGLLGFDLSGSSSSLVERVYVMPKPGTDRLISTLADGITVTQPGPNNTVRLSRAIRTLDDGISPHTWVWGSVQSVSSARVAVITAAGDTSLSQGRPLPVQSNVVFERATDGAILGDAVVTAESSITSVNGVNQVTVTFDRDLPANVTGAYMYATDPSWRGDGMQLQRNTVQEQGFARGMSLWGLMNATVSGTYLHRTAMSAIHLTHSLGSVDWLVPPLVGVALTNNVIDGAPTELDSQGNLELAAIQANAFASNFSTMPTSPHQNLTFTGNFIANSSRSAFYVGNTTGASLSNNYVFRPNTNPRKDRVGAQFAADILKPIAIENSISVSTGNNPIDASSGYAWVTDTQYRELAAYAPGGTVRLNAYGLGALATPTVTLTDADGVTRPVTIQATSGHALDLQLPPAAGFGGAYLTVASEGAKVFGTLFLDSQDNIPARNGCVYEVDPSSTAVSANANTLSVLVVTQAGCSYQATAADGWVVPGASSSGTGLVSLAFAPNTGAARTTTIEIAGQPFTIAQNDIVTLDRTALTFAAVNNGAAFTAVTPPQSVRMTQSAPGAVSWTASSNQPWLVVSPASGSGTTTLAVSTQFVPGLGSAQTGTITIRVAGATDSAAVINVTLNSIPAGTSTAPFGSFDTPADASTGLAGSVAVTGWALDDVQVTRVTICRDPVGESAPPNVNCGNLPKLYIADALFIDGARPDVQAAFSTLPLNTRGGWGYLMLTNFLPGLGNGTYVISAFAYDGDGHTTPLGSKTITCSNAASFAPFGAIDTPAQGAVVSGAAYPNTGWVLAQRPTRADPPGGGAVNVYVDGTLVGAPSLWATRPDLQALFVPASSYPGIGTALGIFGLDTTTLTNGVHTIFWIATGTGASGTSGIGSRFITVSNGSATRNTVHAAPGGSTVIASNATLDVPHAAAMRIGSAGSLDVEIAAAATDVSVVQGRRGFDLDRPLQAYTASAGRVEVQAEELDRIELHLSGPANQYSGYLRTMAGLQPLPVGSSLDASTGLFTWTPGVGFYGAYDLTFVRWAKDHAIARQDVHIVLNPKGSNRVGPQTIVDAPATGRVFSAGAAFYVGGWAADLDAAVGTGVDTVHVWAYPIDPSGTALDPIFLGPAVSGGARPDVAAVYSDRFTNSGYGLIVNGLGPGTYDIAVFAHSTAVGDFTPAKVVRVTVK